MRHIVSALQAFLGRYWSLFKAHWAVRHTYDAPARSAQELEFLPAHLELIETPASPALRWTMRTIIAFFCVALLWACIGKLDVVAVAQGKTVVGSRTKVLQPAETAIVRRILVRDGQRVRAGQLLIELDTTATTADHEKAGDALLSARLAELRFAALADAVDAGGRPRLEQDARLPLARREAEQRLATSDYAAFNARRLSLLATIAQRQAEIHTIEDVIPALEESARIARTRSTDYATLLEGKYVGRHDYLLREQERIAAERDLGAQRNRVAELRSALLGAREELRVLVTGMRQQTLDQLRQAREQRMQFDPEVAKTAQRDRQMHLRAPVDGTVQQLAVHTVGGVVTPAQPLLAVVPADEALEVEATVLNKDIGFVRAGQAVTVKIESFPYTRFGYLTGTVETISHDAAQDEKLGLVFPARVRLHGTTLNIDGVAVRLTPGMTLSAEIKTGKRRVIDYLLSPLQRHVDEGMRER